MDLLQISHSIIMNIMAGAMQMKKQLDCLQMKTRDY